MYFPSQLLILCGTFTSILCSSITKTVISFLSGAVVDTQVDVTYSTAIDAIIIANTVVSAVNFNLCLLMAIWKISGVQLDLYIDGFVVVVHVTYKLLRLTHLCMQAILKRLMQRGVQLGPNILCAALLVVSEVSVSR